MQGICGADEASTGAAVGGDCGLLGDAMLDLSSEDDRWCKQEFSVMCGARGLKPVKARLIYASFRKHAVHKSEMPHLTAGYRSSLLNSDECMAEVPSEASSVSRSTA